MSDFDDLDSDLFENVNSSSAHVDEEELSTSFDNVEATESLCPICEVDHSNPLNLSGSELRAFRKYLENMPPFLRHSLLTLLEKPISESNPARGLTESFMSYERQTSEVEPLGPIVRAVAKVLDDMSGGQVSIYRDIFELERQLLRWHKLLRRINNYASAVVDETFDSFPTLKPTIDYIVLLCQSRIDIATEKYIDLGERYDIPLDKQMVETGITSKPEGSIEHFLTEGLFSIYSRKE